MVFVPSWRILYPFVILLVVEQKVESHPQAWMQDFWSSIGGYHRVGANQVHLFCSIVLFFIFSSPVDGDLNVNTVWWVFNMLIAASECLALHLSTSNR